MADFRNSNEAFEIIKSNLNSVDIGLLINNVGTALPRVIDFLDNKKYKVNDMVEVNMKSTLIMCSLALNIMAKKNKGVIINVASLLSTIPSPGAAVYGATKVGAIKTIIKV